MVTASTADLAMRLSGTQTCSMRFLRPSRAHCASRQLMKAVLPGFSRARRETFGHTA